VVEVVAVVVVVVVVVFENGCRGRCLGLKGTKKQGNEGRCTMGSFLLCAAHLVLFG
jgi:hypothetical protein